MECVAGTASATAVETPAQPLDTPSAMTQVTTQLIAGLYAWTCKQP